MQNLEKLKAFCNLNGFDFDYHDKSGVVLISDKKKEEKDVWEGVEFVQKQSDSIIVKTTKTVDTGFYYADGYVGISVCLPSTESAYKAQLEKIALDKYGEIKNGDRFDRSMISDESAAINPVRIMKAKKGFHYSKHSDQLRFGGRIIYQQGIWAVKLHQRVEVRFINSTGLSEVKFEDGRPNNGKYVFEFRIENGYKNCHDAGRLLATTLEAYLNGDTPKIPSHE